MKLTKTTNYIVMVAILSLIITLMLFYTMPKVPLAANYNTAHGITMLNTNKASNKNGLIFISGNFVPKQNYSGLFNVIGENGFNVFILQSSYNSDYKTIIAKLIQTNPNVSNWVIGGHSFGGSIACRASSQIKKFNTVLLVNSYCNNIDLNNIKVININNAKGLKDHPIFGSDVTNYEAPINHSTASNTRTVPFDQKSKWLQSDLATYIKNIFDRQNN